MKKAFIKGILTGILALLIWYEFMIIADLLGYKPIIQEIIYKIAVGYATFKLSWEFVVEPVLEKEFIEQLFKDIEKDVEREKERNNK